LAPKGGGAAARAVTGIVGKAAARVMSRIAGKATRAGVRRSGRQSARQASRLGNRLRNLRNRLTGRRNAAGGDTTKPLDGRHATKDPIDVASGEVFLNQIDLELPGVLPLVLERTHVSSFRTGRWFGPGWSSTLDQRLEVDNLGVCLVTTEGRILTYPIGVYGQPVWPLKGERWPLIIDGDSYTVHQPQTGTTLHFAPQPNAGIPGEAVAVLPIKAISDRNGNRIDFDYDGQGALVRIRHSGGYVIDVDTDDGLITALRMGETALKTFDYDEAANLTEVAGPTGAPTRFDYDEAGRLTRWTDTNGNWYAYTYDERGRAIRGTGSGGYLNVALEYHDDRTVLTDSLGHRTVYHFNERRQLVAETNPLGAVTRYEWDDNDRLLTVTDPLGRTVRYTYDEFSNITSITRPDGAVTTITYNDQCRPTQIVEFDGAIWNSTYDERGNLLTQTDPTGAVIRCTYDERGALTSVTDPAGGTTRIECNPAGLPIAVTNSRGGVTRYRYNPLGRITELVDPIGGVSTFTWTPDGRLTSRTTPDGASEHWSYDHEGNLVEYTRPTGQTTRWEIGPFDQPIAWIGPDGGRLEFAYDTELRLTSVTNPQGLVWRYAYDVAGNLISETDFNGRVVHYAYDAAGQLTTYTNGAGQVTAFTRDVLGAIVRKDAGGEITTFTYDRAGRLVRAVNTHADLRLERDLLGRVTAEICNGRVLRWTYDEVGNRVRRRTPSGAESVWTYDPAGLPLSLTTAGQVITFEHDAAGREVRRRIGTGVILDQQWDAVHRLTSQALWGAPASPTAQPRLLQHRTYSYRPDDYPIAITDRLSGHRAFELDAVGRITAVQGQGGNERYTYDSAGNIIHALWPTDGDPSALSADAAGERSYTGVRIRRAGRIHYEYDAQGRVVLRRHARLSSKPLIWRFYWNAEDRLTSVQTPDGHWWRYLYDPLGRRIAKQHLAPDGKTLLEQIDFIWEGPSIAEQIHYAWSAGQLSADHVTTWDYEPGTFQPLTQSEHITSGASQHGRAVRRFHAIIADLVGTPVELVAPDGSISWRSHAAVWGAPYVSRADQISCPLGFPGQYYDSETGLYFNYFRYYSPFDGRYLSPDPLGLSPQPNPYIYVINPFVWADPFGLYPHRQGKEPRYGSHELSRKVIDYRVENPNVLPKQNVALYRVEVPGERPGETIVRDLFFANERRGKHSEKIADEYLTAHGIDPSWVKAIYSERNFCTTPGHECAGLVRKYANAELYWTFDRYEEGYAPSIIRKAVTDAFMSRKRVSSNFS